MSRTASDFFKDLKGNITVKSIPLPLPVDGMWFVGTNLQHVRHGWNEKPTAEYIRKHLQKGQTFIDIGANYGFYSVLAAKLGAKVISYEPDKTSFRRLNINLALNHVSSELHNAAVKNYEGTTEFYVKAPGSGRNSTVPGIIEGRKRVVQAEKCTAQYDLCKIDVEGAELQVLKGMTHRGTIICELYPIGFDLTGSDPAQFLEEIHAMGWRTEDIEEGELSDAELIAKARKNRTLNIILKR